MWRFKIVKDDDLLLDIFIKKKFTSNFLKNYDVYKFPAPWIIFYLNTDIYMFIL